MELRGLGAINAEFEALGCRIVAVTVDAPQESARVVKRNRLPFPILSDVDLSFARAYSLVHAAGGPAGQDVLQPAHVLVARDGTILWRRVAARVQDRLEPDVVLATVTQHLGNPS